MRRRLKNRDGAATGRSQNPGLGSRLLAATYEPSPRTGAIFASGRATTHDLRTPPRVMLQVTMSWNIELWSLVETGGRTRRGVERGSGSIVPPVSTNLHLQIRTPVSWTKIFKNSLMYCSPFPFLFLFFFFFLLSFFLSPPFLVFLGLEVSTYQPLVLLHPTYLGLSS